MATSGSSVGSTFRRVGATQAPVRPGPRPSTYTSPTTPPRAAGADLEPGSFERYILLGTDTESGDTAAAFDS